MPKIDLSEPYVGPRPFERKDSDIFFGRDREANYLLSLITAHPIVLLYASSGAGKSSLLNAKLIPRLEADDFEVLHPGRVCGLSSRNINSEKIANIYVFNALTYWAEGRLDGERLSTLSLADFLKKDSRLVGKKYELEKPRVVILDQFEELFTSAPDQWKDRKGFFEQLGEALADNLLLRVVLAMHEDYIAELDPYVSAVPERLHTRFRLEPLREGAALAAVKGPLRNKQHHFADGVAEKLVKKLLSISVRTAEGIRVVEGEYVDPIYLQVACRNLWENLRSSSDDVITDEGLEDLSDVNHELEMFYEKAVRKVSETTGIKEGRIRRWFEQTLITTGGTRELIFQSAEETGGLPNTAVEELEKERLINGKLKDSARWYELAHDRLIKPIKESSQKWLLTRSSAEEKRKELEAKATKWLQGKRSRRALMDKADTVAAERWLASNDADELGYSDTLSHFVKASRSAITEAARLKKFNRAEAPTREQRKKHMTSYANGAPPIQISVVLDSGIFLNEIFNEKYPNCQIGYFAPEFRVYGDGQSIIGPGLPRAPSDIRLVQFRLIDKSGQEKKDGVYLDDLRDHILLRQTIYEGEPFSPYVIETRFDWIFDFNSGFFRCSQIKDSLFKQMDGRTNQPNNKEKAYKDIANNVVIHYELEKGERLELAVGDQVLWKTTDPQVSMKTGEIKEVVSRFDIEVTAHAAVENYFRDALDLKGKDYWRPNQDDPEPIGGRP